MNEDSAEIRQHYDDSYDYHLNLKKFIESQKSKENYLKKQGSSYNLFVVPDKSVLLRNFLPFETKEPKRVINSLSEYVHDLSHVLNEFDYYLTDSHITKVSGLKCIAYILSIIHPEKTVSEYSKLLWSKLHVNLEPHKGDLLFNENWSYGVDDYYKKYLTIASIDLLPNNKIENLNKRLPQDLKIFKSRHTYYFRNENSISDKKAVILRDSSVVKMFVPLICYYREIIFYWDYWYFNKHLIEWFKPDDVIEIRTERFLSRPLSPIINDEEYVKIKVMPNITHFSVSKKILNFEIILKDEHLMPIKSSCLFNIDNDKYFKEVEINEIGLCKLRLDLNNLNKGKHTLFYKIKETEITQGFENSINFTI